MVLFYCQDDCKLSNISSFFIFFHKYLIVVNQHVYLFKERKPPFLFMNQVF